jgi:hypothetical protein
MMSQQNLRTLQRPMYARKLQRRSLALREEEIVMESKGNNRSIKKAPVGDGVGMICVVGEDVHC